MKKALLLIVTIFLIPVMAVADESFFPEETYLPDIETFMQIGWSADGSISRDGETILFTTSFTEANQLFRLTDEGWPYQLTFFKDGIDWYQPSHNFKYAIIGGSVGGNEDSQLYLMDVRTGRLRQLTNSPSVRYGSVLWSWDDKTIYYRSNKRNGTDFEIWKMDLADGEEVLVQGKAGYNGPAGLTKDSKYLLTYTYESNVNNNYFLLNLATGEETLLTPHEGDAIFYSVNLTPDYKFAYLVSNYNEDGIARLAKMNVETREIEFLNPDTKWGVEGCGMTEDGNTLLWLVNEDGYSIPYLQDLQTGEMLPVPPLKGLFSGGAMTETGKVLFGFNSSTKAPDIWLWDWNTEELTQITHSSYAGIDPDIFTDPELIHYESFDGLEIPAFLYLPPGYESGKIPFIIHAHGGPEGQYRPSFSRHFTYLMQNGFGILAINPRGSEGYGREYMNMDNYKKRLDSVKDYAWGAKWLIKNGYTDESILGIKGGSYGGYMVMASLTEYPSLYRAGFNSVGIVNFVTFLKNTRAYRRALRESEYGPLEDSTFLASISPIHKVDKIKAALFVQHGENDPRVPVDEARQIISAMEEQGGEIEYVIYPDEGHGIGKLSNRLDNYRKMVDFFKKYLKKGMSN